MVQKIAGLNPVTLRWPASDWKTFSVNAALDGYLFQINETVKERISASTN